jgi:uncharacterized protein YbjT (DUF2867 family)
VKVVVTAPAGHVGSRVVRLLIQAGVRPTLLTRRRATLDPGTGRSILTTTPTTLAAWAYAFLRPALLARQG